MALTNKLSAIGDAIREKTGKTELLTLDQMPVEIKAIETGGGELPEEALVISGDCQYRFFNNGWNWFIDTYGNRITTENISDADNMFASCELSGKELPFVLNFDSSIDGISMKNLFYQNSGNTCQLEKTPTIGTPGKIGDMDYMFSNCHYLKEVSDDFVNGIDWTYMDGLTSATKAKRIGMFEYCYSLRSCPVEFFRHGNPLSSNGYSIYYYTFRDCYSLDEIKFGFPHYNATWTSNAFYRTVVKCYRLKNFTFDLQEDGTPYVMKWKNQIIDLSSNMGYGYGNATWLGDKAGKEIVDDATYQAYKDDPDCYTKDANYSRYNHDSAVNTINTLPDCSATGTNTIKFLGVSGALTDGGAINTLTEEEIAVATAKGWTVSFV